MPAAAPLLAMIAAGAGLFSDLRRAPPAPPAGFASLAPLLRGDERLSRAGWPRIRERIEREWRERLGPFPERVPLGAETLAFEELPDHTRLLVRYRIDGDTAAEAYVLLPGGRPRRRPGVVVLHQTTAEHSREPVGLAGREAMHVALRLVRRGFACVAPRNFLWSEPGKSYEQVTAGVRRRWRTGMARMTWDAIRATDLLAERPEVDRRRLGSIGHSLGAKEVLYHAAFDPRIRAAVSCEGGIGVSFSNWDAEWYLGPQARAPAFPDHHELLALVAPRAFLLVGGGSADGPRSWPYIEAALPAWRLHGAEERLGLLLHPHGHDFPPPGEERETIHRWLERWLDRKPG